MVVEIFVLQLQLRCQNHRFVLQTPKLFQFTKSSTGNSHLRESLLSSLVHDRHLLKHPCASPCNIEAEQLAQSATSITFIRPLSPASVPLVYLQSSLCCGLDSKMRPFLLKVRPYPIDKCISVQVHNLSTVAIALFCPRSFVHLSWTAT